MSDSVLESQRVRRPPRWALALAVSLLFATPFVARLSDFPIGDYAMFARIERYHLDLMVDEPTGSRGVPVRSLAPHLSRDARAVILPAASTGFGKDQTDLLAGGLTDLTQLLCELYPAATGARARLGRGPLPPQGSREPAERAPLVWQEVSQPCIR